MVKNLPNFLHILRFDTVRKFLEEKKFCAELINKAKTVTAAVSFFYDNFMIIKIIVEIR